MKTFAETEISFPLHPHPSSLSSPSPISILPLYLPYRPSLALSPLFFPFCSGTVWFEIRWHISIVPLCTTSTSVLLAVCQTLQEIWKTRVVSVVKRVCGCFKLLKCLVKWLKQTCTHTQRKREVASTIEQSQTCRVALCESFWTEMLCVVDTFMTCEI